MRYNLKAAVIGTGYMGKIYINILKDMVEELVICTTDTETGEKISGELGVRLYSDYKTMLSAEKPSFVAVCLPTHLHAEVTVAAIREGANVLCEKPFAASVAEAEEMIRCADEKNLLLMIAHCVRFSKPYAYMKSLLKDKRYGELLSLKVFRESSRPRWSVGGWLDNSSVSGGVIRDLNIHNTDIIIGLLGEPYGARTFGTDAVVQTVYNYGAGIAVSSSASWKDVKDTPFESGFDAIFEHAWVRSKDDGTVVYTDDGVADVLLADELSHLGDDIYTNEIEYFCRMLECGGRVDLCPPSESLKALRVSFAESKSLECGCEQNI